MQLMVKVQSPAWTPVLVDTDALETYWRRHADYLPGNGLRPKCDWFDRFEHSRPTMFKLSVAYFAENRHGQPCVHFNNGRHRARWLLENNVRDVVLALASETVDAAVEACLVRRVFQQGELFDLGFEVPANAMAHRGEPGDMCTCGFIVNVSR
jgi:hypothetical protein